jgi:transposase
VNKRFRVCSHDQPFLLPPSLQDWLPEDHPARFVADVMNELDLSTIYASYERSDGRGLAAYHPVLTVRLLLYGYCVGVTSSRKIEQATYDNVALVPGAAGRRQTANPLLTSPVPDIRTLGSVGAGGG